MDAQTLKKLTKKNLVHMLENGITDLPTLRMQANFLAEQRFPCWECADILKRLEIPFELTAFHAGVNADN